MANFNTHINVAFVASSITGLIAYKAGMLTASEFFLCNLAGTVGGLLPDIDLNYSIPAKVGFNLASLLVAFLMMVYWAKQISIIWLLLLWVFTYAVMRWGVFRLFNHFTIHRGIVHSVPYMAILSLSLVLVSFYGMRYDAVFSWFLGLFLFFGTIIHLILDEIYSVNFLNLKVKKSFGTALKFFSFKQVWWYVGLYVLLIVMLVLAPPFHLFWQTLTDPMSCSLLKSAIL